MGLELSMVLKKKIHQAEDVRSQLVTDLVLSTGMGISAQRLVVETPSGISPGLFFPQKFLHLRESVLNASSSRHEPASLLIA
jgi:hypothetical protein